MVGSNERELAKEFGQSRKMRDEVERPVWHNSLRLPRGERISNEKWNEVADDYMQKMGFTDLHQRVYVMHDDSDGQHIHIIASRISIVAGDKLYLGQNENLKSTKIINQLERDHGLVITQTEPDPNKPRQRAPSRSELGLAERAGQLPIKMQLQAIIDAASEDKPHFSEFIKRLNDTGVSILPSGKTGSPQGVSFEVAGQAFKGSDLGKSYAWKGLKSRIDFSSDRDQPIIDALRRTCTAQDDEKGELSTTLPATPNPYKGPPRTLELTLEREGGTYKWKTGGRIALVDNGTSIDVFSKNDSAIRASLQLSRDKGWQSVVATGSDDFKRKTWLIGSSMGLKIQGYEPTQADIDELKNILAQKEAIKNERKNSRTQSQSSETGAAPNDGERIGEPGSADGNRLESDLRTSGDIDTRSDGSESSTRQHLSDTSELQTADSSNPQSPNLADAPSVHINRGDISSIRDAAIQLSDIAAPLSEDRNIESAGGEERPSDLQPALTKEHAAKIAAWQKQSEALGAEKYRITLKPRAETGIDGRKLYDQNYGNKGNKGNRGFVERFWSKDEITAEITKLRAKNAQGYDIYITPISAEFHHIVVDDMDTEKERGLLEAGIKPAIIQRSSENNKQAIFIIEKQKKGGSSESNQAMANKIVHAFNQKWGDPKFNGVVHPFRMAGFSNKKPGKNNYITTLELAEHRMCHVTSSLMQKYRDEEALKSRAANQADDMLKDRAKTEGEFNRRMSKINGIEQADDDAVTIVYRREVYKILGLAKKQGWTLDWSRVDFAATKEMLKNNYKPERIERAIIEASPQLVDRHRDAARFAADTVKNAAINKDVLNHKLSEQLKRDNDENNNQMRPHLQL